MKAEVAKAGYKWGWDDAALYARGTKADRREVRRRIAKSAASGAPFWRSYRDAIIPRTEDFARAIREGRLPRTCNPHKLLMVVSRASE